MEIELCGIKVQIDKEDEQKIALKKWHLDKKNYVVSGVWASNTCKSLYLHRYVMGALFGDSRIVDHINGNIHDNRKENLRFVTKQQNTTNRSIHKNNKTGFKGVTIARKKYRARIRLYGTVIHLGVYETPEQAHAAYCEASKKYHGEYGRIE